MTKDGVHIGCSSDEMEFAESMKTFTEFDDPEIAHRCADELMCEKLKELGFGAGIEIFENMEEKKCLCEEIQTYEKITKGPFRGGYYPPKDEDSIVYDPETKTFDIWSDGGGDPFQAGSCVEDIKFCPVCGKELKGAEE